MSDVRPVVSVPDERWLGLWPRGEEPVDVLVWDMTGDAPGAPALVVLPYIGAAGVAHRLAEVPGLRVAQTLSAGYEHVLAHVPDGVTLATAAGVHDASTAELAVGLAIAALRGFPDFVRAASRGAWENGPEDVAGRPAGAARRRRQRRRGDRRPARPVRGRPHPGRHPGPGRRSRPRARRHGAADLLPRHEVVVLACPLTERTRGMVDAEFLARMPDGALLVNVARGGVVVTDALVSELASGRLLAALDVTDPEPLPPGHPLWSLPNVLISPHVGGDTTAFPPRARALLKDQFERFVDGRPLRNVVR